MNVLRIVTYKNAAELYFPKELSRNIAQEACRFVEKCTHPTVFRDTDADELITKLAIHLNYNGTNCIVKPCKSSTRYECYYSSSTGYIQVGVIKDNSLTWNGSISDFVNQEYSEKLSALKGKIVRFYYDSGSHKDYRVVKVDNVEHVFTPQALIRGKDCLKNECRSYRVCHIKGDIEVIN